MPNEHAQRRALTPLMCQHAPSFPYLAYRPMTDHPSHPSIRGFIPSAYSKSPMPRYQQLLPFLSPWIAANTFRPLILLLQSAYLVALALHPCHPVNASSHIFTHLRVEADILHEYPHPMSALERGHQPIPGYHNPYPRGRRLLVPAQTPLPIYNVATVLASAPS